MLRNHHLARYQLQLYLAVLPMISSSPKIMATLDAVIAGAVNTVMDMSSADQQALLGVIEDYFTSLVECGRRLPG